MIRLKRHPKVSVVVPTYNLKEILLECLDSIINQDYHNLEVIVVDNASTDGTSEAVKKKFPKVKLIRNQKNLGVTGGANAGLKEATGDYIWLVDHDNILNPNMLSEMVKLAESDPKIGVVVPKILYWENKDIIWAAGTGMNLITGENIFRGGKDIGQYEKVKEVDIAPANFLVKREVIEKVGLYDDIYFVSYEDADFSFRVRKAGYKIIYTPKALCYHKIPLLDEKASKQRWLSRSHWTARNKIIFMRKNSPYFAIFILLYPIWFLIYTCQAIRYFNFQVLFNFYKGMKDGFKWAFFEYDGKNNQ
ncbi:MAG: glycosyltransferase family 2 protein [Patescibacteria group bacterium]